MTRLAVVGTGAWGTALAMHASAAGLDVALLGRRPELVARLRGTRRHPALEGAPPIAEGVLVTADPAEAFAGAGMVLWSVSVQATSGEARRLSGAIPAGVPVVSTSKGLETETHLRVTQLLDAALGGGHPLAVLSGPTFAAEVARGLPAVAVVASLDEERARQAQELLSSPTLRLYRSVDVVGVEIAGAAKNVYAIAAGIVDGLRLGQNTRAALVTRALAETRRLGTALGGSADTFAGLAGVGDLLLTATGDLSRNRRVGLALAAGKDLAEALGSLGGEVAEGVFTAAALDHLSRENGVEMPIAQMVVEILTGRVPAREAVRALMTRGLKDERR